MSYPEAADSEESAGAPVEVEVVVIAAMEEAFSDWRADNGYLLDMGLCGDLVDLRLRLNAAATNAFISS
jgi:hypothetical protein